MSFEIEIIPGAPIVVVTHAPGPEMAAEIAAAMQEMATMLNALPRPVYLVLDLSGLKRMTLEDIMVTSDKAARGPGAVMHHPKIIETLFVLADHVARQGIMGMTSEVYGKARVQAFDTRDQALAYCHEKIADLADK